MVVPNVDNISLGRFAGLDIEQSFVTIDENHLTRATNVIARGGDLVKRPPFRQGKFPPYDHRTSSLGYVSAPCRALISPPGEIITVGPTLEAPDTTFYKVRSWDDRDGLFGGINLDTGPTANPAIPGRSEKGADFVSVAKVGADYYFGGPGGLWRLQPGTLTWTKVVLPDANSGVRQVVYFKNRLWVVSDGFNSDPARMFYSAPVNPTSIVGTINIAWNESLGPLRAIIPYSDRLLCFTDESVWNLYLSGDTASWSQRLFLRGLGVHNPQSIIEYNGMIYFLNNHGLFRTDGNVLAEVSAPIRKWISSISTINGLSEYSIALHKDTLIVRINRGPTGAAYSMFLYNMEWDAWTGCVVNPFLNHNDQDLSEALNNYMTGMIDQYGNQFVLCGTNSEYLVDFGDPPEGINPGTYYQDFQRGATLTHVNYFTEFRTKHLDAGKMPRLKDVICAQVEMVGSEDGGTATQHDIDGWWLVDSNMNVPVNTRKYNETNSNLPGPFMYTFPGARYARRFSFHFREASSGYIKITEMNLEAVAKRDDPKNPSV